MWFHKVSYTTQHELCLQCWLLWYYTMNLKLVRTKCWSNMIFSSLRRLYCTLISFLCMTSSSVQYTFSFYSLHLQWLYYLLTSHTNFAIGKNSIMNRKLVKNQGHDWHAAWYFLKSQTLWLYHHTLICCWESNQFKPTEIPQMPSSKIYYQWPCFSTQANPSQPQNNFL